MQELQPRQDLRGQSLPRGRPVLWLQRPLCRLLDRDRRAPLEAPALRQNQRSQSLPRGRPVLWLQRLLCRLLDRDRRAPLEAPGPGRTCGANRSRGASWSYGSYVSFVAFWTGIAGSPLRPLRSRLPLSPGRTWGANRSRGAGWSHGSNVSCVAFCTEIAGSPLRPQRSRLSLRPGYTLNALGTPRTCGTLCASFTLRAGWPRILAARREQDRHTDHNNRYDFLHPQSPASIYPQH